MQSSDTELYPPRVSNNRDPMGKGDVDFCSYTAFGGVMIAAACLIQLMVVARFHWITLLLSSLYLFSIVTYIMLALQKPAAVALLYSNIVAGFVIVFIYFSGAVLSLLVILLVIYNVVIAAIVYVENLALKIREKEKIIKAEREFWKGKL